MIEGVIESQGMKIHYLANEFHEVEKTHFVCSWDYDAGLDMGKTIRVFF